MASNKLEKERQKLINEKCLSILNELLRDEDNKYCVDCDAKGPRWASWNLGIFLCIRCAGIHRNLGVHISRVKSVNLDAWTPEQIACLQNMGNSKARAVYEANLPDNFRRPQTDSSLEAFVRAKYELKKYIAKEWVEPPPPKPAFDIEEELRKEKERKRNKNKPLQSQNNIEVQSNSLPRPNSSPAGTVINADKIPQEVMKRGEIGKNNTSDLLGLEVSSTSDSKADDDSFGIFVSSVSAIDTTDNMTNNKSEPNIDEESDFFNQKAPTDEKKVMSKESILSLYGSASQQQPQ
jgi:stromal membrane-associated protein